MKKLFAVMLSLLIVATFVFIGCEKKPEPPQENPPAFVRKVPAKAVASLSAEQLDALMAELRR